MLDVSWEGKFPPHDLARSGLPYGDSLHDADQRARRMTMKAVTGMSRRGDDPRGVAKTVIRVVDRRKASGKVPYRESGVDHVTVEADPFLVT